MPPGAIHIGINTVDTSFFTTATQEYRRSHPCPAMTHRFLCLGHLTKGKRIDLVLQALNLLRKHRTDFELVLVGSGPAEPDLRCLCNQLGLQNNVRFAGFVQRNNLPPYFGSSTALLFPSEYDIWGLVLNEAMAAGLPCLASRKAGATHDLIVHEQNGFALDFEDTTAVAGRLLWLLSHPDQAQSMGVRAQQHVRTHASLAASASGFLNAVVSHLN